MDKLFLYLRLRAEFEQVDFDLDENYLLELYDLGTRSFFGVRLNEKREMLFDLEEPVPGFFNSFMSPS